MSGSNPYAVNGNSTNPFAANNPYDSATRFANDPYLQNNASSASVNSYGSRNDRRRGATDQSALNAAPNRPSPSITTSFLDNTRRDASPSSAGGSDSRFARGARPGGGYGGMGAPYANNEYERQQTPPAATRPRTANQERERSRDKDRDRAYSDARGRDRRMPDVRDMPPPPMLPAAADGANRYHSPVRPAKSIDEILRHIQSEWRNMEGDECVPVKVALQLMDPSSIGLGEKEPDFADTHVDLQKALKKVVNEHYADFNSAVGTYHKIQASIRESQSRVRYLKTGLIGVKSGMLTTRPELRGLAEQSGELDAILSVLTQMETLREMPGRLEERISEKRWISAVDLLEEALRSCRKSDLDDIGAIADLRGYFATQETSLLDVLVEELHDHLYLKSPYCQDRWKGRKADGGEKDARETFNGNSWDRPVYQFLSSLDTKTAMIEDASKNPEAETFRYIHMLIEALHKLGYLDEAVLRIEQRMPMELYKVVDRTNSEVDVKYPLHIRNQLEKDKRSLRVLQMSDARSQVLSDFLWTLYAKFEAIAEGHRVLHDVIIGIAERDKVAKREKYITSFKELWKLYQMEIRSLLHDYLAADGDVTLGKGMNSTSKADLFTKRTRDRSKRMFKLSEMDEKAPDLRAEAEELDQILKSSVPGLVSKSKIRAGVAGVSDRTAPDGTAAGHKLLIEPSVFNMMILLPPSLTFLQHLKDIVPQTSQIAMSTLTSFLDDFLINVFHPQLEEAVTELCTQCIMDMEAFTEASQWAKHSPRPIFKGTIAFMSLILAFSGMLSSIPQDQMFTRLIIDQLTTYYARCSGFYKSMVSRVSTSANSVNGNVLIWKTAAGFAESGELHDLTVELMKSDIDRETRRELINKSVQAILTATKANPISSYDIISDPKSVHQLSLLHNSMQWLSASLSQLRHVDNTAASKKAHSRNASQSNNHANQRRWTLITSLKTPGSSSPGQTINPIFLPLNSETAVPFDTNLQSFRELAQCSLMTLHLDVRCGVLHQLDRALRPISDSTQQDQQRSTTPSGKLTPIPDTRALDSSNYPFVLSSPPTSASPRILSLNNDLIAFDANVSTYLGPSERRFIFTGLGRLVDRFLVVGADHIQVMNHEGAERMRVDIMVVQQVLRGLGVDRTANASLQLSADLASLTTSGSNSLLQSKETSTQATATTTSAANVGLGISSPTSPTFPPSSLPFNTTTTSTAQQSQEEEQSSLTLLTTSSKYYALFLDGPDNIMNHVRERKNAIPPQEVGYSYDELRTLIELCFSVALRGGGDAAGLGVNGVGNGNSNGNGNGNGNTGMNAVGDDREVAVKARKKLNDLLLLLGEIMWDS